MWVLYGPISLTKPAFLTLLIFLTTDLKALWKITVGFCKAVVSFSYSFSQPTNIGRHLTPFIPPHKQPSTTIPTHNSIRELP